MSPISSISLTPLPQSGQGKITQLYHCLELFSEGDPVRHSLFVFAPSVGPISLGSGAPSQDQLLVIDPPTDISQRFRLSEQVAALYTSNQAASPITQVQTQPGGVAHLRIGEHFLDIYSQRHSNIVHLPALGILCGGNFGSDSTIPRLMPDDDSLADGNDELEALRILARIVKQSRLSLYIPQVGTETGDKMTVMERLATDVGYIHALRRVVTPLALRGESMEAVSDLAESVLPREKRTPQTIAIHNQNINALVQGAAR